MLAHMTVNGASTAQRRPVRIRHRQRARARPARLAIELGWNGTSPLQLPDGSRRSWLHDGDEVTISATAAGPDGTRIGLGSATGPAFRRYRTA